MRDSKVQHVLQNIGLVELSQIFLNNLLVASHILGSQQIDTIWSTPNINLSSLSILPYYFAVGDYRYFVIDFPIDYFIGDGFIPIICPEMRRLALSNKDSINQYLSRV